MKKGFIVKENSGVYDVYNGVDIVSCKARGKFRAINTSPLVGDEVLYDESLNYIMEISERINTMIRPNLANVEALIIVASTFQPRINLSLITRYILLSESCSIKPLIVLSKIDLCNDGYDKELASKLNKMGYETILYSSKTLQGLDEIKEYIKNKKVVFSGQSGVGKSNLINLLIPGSKQQTQEISDALNRGKHTTRIVEYLKGENYWIADTPGFSSIDISMSVNDVATYYPSFKKYVGKCKFNNCLHDKEIGCSIKMAVENNEIDKEVYEDYLKLLNDLRNKRNY